MPDDPAAAQLRAAVDRFLSRAGHWSDRRWSEPATAAAGPGVSRAEAVHGLAQYLADTGASVEDQPRRPVPRLAHDTALTDQIQVLAADLIRAAAPEPVLRAAATTVQATTRCL